MTKPTVLISGAGIAGPSLAYWLTRAGCHVVLVEIDDGIRPGGQTVDLRGAGRADGAAGSDARPQLGAARCRLGEGRRAAYAPNSAADIIFTAMAMKYMQRWPFRSLAERKWFTTADAVDLPDYPASSKARRA